MEIIVEGRSTGYFRPDELVMNVFFTAKGNTYNEAIQNGINSVYAFNSAVLLNNGFIENDLKTRNFSVVEDKVYNETTRQFEVRGFIFNQDATLRTDYTEDLLSNLVNSISTLDSSTNVTFNFGLKDEEVARRSLYEKSYDDALLKAETLAKVTGQRLGNILSIDSRGANYNIFSSTNIDNRMLTSLSNASVGLNFIHPEDIEISESILVKWTVI